MAIKLYLSGALTILVGLLILFVPSVIRVALGLYLVIIGILNLSPDF